MIPIETRVVHVVVLRLVDADLSSVLGSAHQTNVFPRHLYTGKYHSRVLGMPTWFDLRDVVWVGRRPLMCRAPFRD
jgi:hypothetical protein